MQISSDIIAEITRKIIDQVHPDKVVLFGSFARGDYKETSDLDLLVIKESPLPRYKRAKDIRLLLRKYMFPKDILVYTPEEVKEWEDVPMSFITTAMREGKLLYEKK